MRYKLREIFDLQMGKTPSRNNMEYWKEKEYKWISIADLSKTEKYISETKEYLSDRAVRETGIRVIPANTVVMSFKLSIGKVAITAEDMYSNEAIMAFRDKHVVEILPEYIFYLFKWKKWDEGVNKAVMGKTLNKATLSEVEIKIYPVERQKEIINVLDKVMEVRAGREKELKALDELIKARFVEMFGDPLSNNRNWSIMALTQVCQDIYGGGTPSKSHPEYFTGTIPWISPKDMKTDMISDSIDHITNEAINNSTTNLVPANSILMVIRSGILKHTLPVAINNVPVTINQDMKAFVPNDVITAEFLMYYFKAIAHEVLAGVRSVTADNIDFKAFQKRRIIVPPIELQNQFADFVTQIDKSKVIAYFVLKYTKSILYQFQTMNYEG